MRGTLFILSILASWVLLVGCRSSSIKDTSSSGFRKNSQISRAEKQEGEHRLWKKIRWEKNQDVKIIHMELRLSFDWEEKEVFGQAKLFLKPYFYPTRELILDAKYFQVAFISLAGDTVPLKFVNDSLQLRVELPREFEKEELIELNIEYRVKPHEAREILGDHWDGLYFVRTEDEKELWTQNETEFASTWFPTIEDPRQKFTHDIFLSVDSNLTTISNGRLVSSLRKGKGEKIEHWKMDHPHSPYLVMIAVGKFAKKSLVHNGLPLSYYLAPEYESSIEPLFQRTPLMIDFLEEKMGVKYPWNKYSQVAVHDFVTGAMENTTVSVFHAGLNSDLKTLVDKNFDDIIVHELAHQWFGNFVTCQDWASVALNEGFATYSEYLWAEFYLGKDEADFYGYEETLDYLDQARMLQHPIMWEDYDNPNKDMFDRHSYAKASRVIHMLRRKVGDDAFWTSLNKYLKENKFGLVSIRELQKSFEITSGLDLKNFFDQWFLRKGHPEITSSLTYFSEDSIRIDINQTQNDNTPFVFPIEVSIFFEDTTIYIEKKIDSWENRFLFSGPGRPLAYSLDPNLNLVFEEQDFSSLESELVKFNRVESPAKKYHLGYRLRDSISINQKGELGTKLLTDSIWYLRSLGLDFLSDLFESVEFDGAQLSLLREICVSDPKSFNRGQALELLPTDSSNRIWFMKGILDSSWYVNSGSVIQLADFEDQPFLTGNRDKLFRDSKDGNMVFAMAAYLVKYFPGTNYSWFFEKEKSISHWSRYWFFDFVCDDIQNGPEESAGPTLEWIKEMVLNSNERFRFFLLSRLEEIPYPSVQKVFNECLAAPQNQEYESWNLGKKKTKN
jgi:aminopeptidase N